MLHTLMYNFCIFAVVIIGVRRLADTDNYEMTFEDLSNKMAKTMPKYGCYFEKIICWSKKHEYLLSL